MFKTFTFFIIMLLGASFTPITKSFAAEGVGRIAYTYGSVWIERGAKLDKLQKGQTVFRHDTIITGSRGRAKILMRDGSKVYVGAKSRIALRQYTMKKDRLFSATINMLWGKARFFVKKLTSKDASFKVKTPTAVLGVRGTEFIVSVPPTLDLLNQSLQHITLRDMPALPTRTALIEGAIQVNTGIGKPVLLRPGHTADISINKTIRTFKTSSDDIDKHDDILPNPAQQDTTQQNQTQKPGKKPDNTKASQPDDDLKATPPSAPVLKGPKVRPPKKPHPAIKKDIDKPQINDTTNAIQNLNSTTDIIIKPSFVQP